MTRCLLCFLAALAASGQAPEPARGPDTILFTNGDKLAGKFVSSTGASVKFKSDAIGDITVDWSKVKELRTAGKVAVLRKGVTVRKRTDLATIPQGTLNVENQQIELAASPAAPAPPAIPVAEANVIIDQPAFEKAVSHEEGFFHDWKGTITLGGTLVQATQNNRTFTGAISLVRVDPSEAWIAPRNRTSFNASAAYGELSQPNTPTVKTSIYHADAERDEYFDHRLFVFGQGAFDHNFSQGLDVQQVYGGGLGWTMLQDPNQTLDLKASMNYVRQQFTDAPDMNLIGSVFAEHYNRKFKHGLIADQLLSVLPAWNNTSAYSATFTTLLTMPVYKRLGASSGVIDTFLNDPPPGFKKNSFQFTLGFTYTLP